MAVLTATDERPEPPDSEFAITVDFRKGEGSPTRVFSAASAMIEAFEKLDHSLVQSVDSFIRPQMVLEDVEVSSLKAWFKNVLNATDDQALKDMDWRPAVGKYLVRAKYMVIRWMEDEDPPKTLPDLRKSLRELAEETDVRRMPLYDPPDTKDLIDFASRVQKAKAQLGSDDRLRYETKDDGEIEITAVIDVADLEDLATKETYTSGPSQLILAVKKPDYLGISRWELRHGKRTISAKIEHEDFLHRFQGRQVDVRPGDALRCMVQSELRYGFDNSLISERYTIVEVLEVLPGAPEIEQESLFGNDLDAE